MDVHADQALRCAARPCSRLGPCSSSTRPRPATTSPTTTSSWCRVAPTWPRATTSTCPPSDGTGTTIPLVVVQHDRRRGPPDGRDGRPSRRDHRHPAGHPVRRRPRRRLLGQAAAPASSTPRSRSSRTRPSATRSRCCPSASHRAAFVVEDGRPVGVLTHEDCLEVDRFTQVHQVMSANPLTLPDTLEPREPPTTGWTPPGAGVAPVVDADGRLVGVLTKTLALRSTLYDARRRRRRAGCASPPRSASTATSRRRPPTCSRPAPTAWSWTPPTATRTGWSRRSRRSGRSTRGVPVAAGNVVSAEGVRGAGRRRRGHRQGRRRSRRDVHHPDDDRGRAAAVLRGARVRRQPPASSASTSGPTGECATPATSPWRWPPAPRR